MRYYQVIITYSCEVCGARHIVNKGSDEKIGEKEKNDLMVSGFKTLKKDFDVKHPEDSFNVERVLIEETNQLGQVRSLPVEKNKIKGILAMVDITEEKFKKKKEEIPFEDTGQTKGMSFNEIKNKVKIRIKELLETNKNCREAMEKLGIQFKETKVEILSLQSLLKATDQTINQSNNRVKKHGKKRKKQKPKSK